MGAFFVEINHYSSLFQINFILPEEIFGFIMKENKFLILGCLIITFLLYFVTYTSTEDQSAFNELSQEEIAFFFNTLDDKQKEGIAITMQDSLKKKFFEDTSAFNKIVKMPLQTYTTFQKISQQSLSIEETLHFYRRLFLLLFLVLGSYITFTKKYKFNITFQKAMYNNVLLSLIFSLFCIFSFILTQALRGTTNGPSFLIQFAFAHFIEVLKSTLIWFVLVSFFIYFNPQNIDWYKRRIEKKKKKLEKQNNE